MGNDKPKRVHFADSVKSNDISYAGDQILPKVLLDRYQNNPKRIESFVQMKNGLYYFLVKEIEFRRPLKKLRIIPRSKKRLTLSEAQVVNYLRAPNTLRSDWAIMDKIFRNWIDFGFTVATILFIYGDPDLLERFLWIKSSGLKPARGKTKYLKIAFQEPELFDTLQRKLITLGLSNDSDSIQLAMEKSETFLKIYDKLTDLFNDNTLDSTYKNLFITLNNNPRLIEHENFDKVAIELQKLEYTNEVYFKIALSYPSCIEKFSEHQKNLEGRRYDQDCVNLYAEDSDRFISVQRALFSLNIFSLENLKNALRNKNNFDIISQKMQNVEQLLDESKKELIQQLGSNYNSIALIEHYSKNVKQSVFDYLLNIKTPLTLKENLLQHEAHLIHNLKKHGCDKKNKHGSESVRKILRVLVNGLLAICTLGSIIGYHAYKNQAKDLSRTRKLFPFFAIPKWQKNLYASTKDIFDALPRDENDATEKNETEADSSLVQIAVRK